MPDNQIETDSPIPLFADPEGIAEAAEKDEPTDPVVEAPSKPAEEPNILFEEVPSIVRIRGRPSQRKGRPPGTKNKATLEREAQEAEKALKKLQSELAAKSAALMMGATGLFAVWRPHFAMTQLEADAIADPLAAWGAKHFEEVEEVRKVVEHWDLVMVTIGIATYLIRVWKDDVQYRIEQQERRNSRGATGPRREANQPGTGDASATIPTVGQPYAPYGTTRNIPDGGYGDSGQEWATPFPAEN